MDIGTGCAWHTDLIPKYAPCLAHRHMRTTLRTLCPAGAHLSLPDAKVSLSVYLSSSLQAGHALGWCEFLLGACAVFRHSSPPLGYDHGSPTGSTPSVWHMLTHAGYRTPSIH